MLLSRMLMRSAVRRAAERLYLGVVTQARNPAFYLDLDVPDSIDGRFDMVALHAFLVLRRLRRETGRGGATAQAFFDLMFEDMDQGLREMGAGDLGVGRRVKAMAKAFYGRLAAYDEGLAAGDETVLAEALVRNLYRGVPPAPETLAALAGYVRREAAALEGHALDELLAGRVSFGSPPAPR